MAEKTTKIFKGSGKKDAKPIQLPLTEGTIEAHPTVSGMVTLRFLEGIGSDDSATQLTAIRVYLDNSFDDENKKKFMDIVEDAKNGYELSDLAEIMSWLVEKRSDDKSFEESSE